jgi:hypothetical protein
MKIWNFTPHKLNIIADASFDASIRKYVANADVKVVTSIPSDGMLSAKITTGDGELVNGNVPTFVKKVTGCDPLPDTVGDDDIVVVSALYVSAYRATFGDDKRLFTVADPVYTEDGKTILGSRGICPAF